MKLSIIIPVYNVEKYLRKCLDSAVRPDGDYELIVVNDGSTDASPAIAEEYAQKYPELIRVISTPNGGLGHARFDRCQVGLRIAVVALLDQRDGKGLPAHGHAVRLRERGW